MREYWTKQVGQTAMSCIDSEEELFKIIKPVVERAQDNWKRTAHAFNSFTLVDPKEIVQTRIIAGLLKPGGIHGQGDTFLRLFLREIEEDFDIPSALSSTSIDIEVMTRTLEADQRRIDLLITLPTGRRIAIESKARGASDQPCQIEAYLDYLNHIQPHDNILIYLSPGNRNPHNVPETKWKEWTNGTKPRIRSFDYDELIRQWLLSCKDSCDKMAASLVIFLNDFSTLSAISDETSPLMNNKMKQEVVSRIISDNKYLVSSIAIHNSCEDVRTELAHKFLYALEKQLRLDADIGGWVVEQSPKDPEGYIGLKLRATDWKTVAAKFQIGPDEGKRPWYRTIGLGVQIDGQGASSTERQFREHTSKPMSPDLNQEFKRIMPRGKQTNQWIWFQHEFADMSHEDVACLLNDCPPDDVKRLSQSLVAVAQSVRSYINALQSR